MNRKWYGAWAVWVYLFIAGCAKEARVNGRMIERQFSKPLASLRLAAETFAETGDATAFDAAKERIRQEGVVRAGLIEAGRQSMPAVAGSMVSTSLRRKRCGTIQTGLRFPPERTTNRDSWLLAALKVACGLP